MGRYGRRVSWNKTYRGFSDVLFGAGAHLTNWAKEWMTDAVKESLREIDSEWPHTTTVTRIGWGKNNVQSRSFGGDAEHPWYSGTLHDSVVGFVSDRGRIVAIEQLPSTPAATTDQTYKGMTINGVEYGNRAARNAARAAHFIPGIYGTLVAGVPYADDVNESARHEGFLDNLQAYFASQVEDYFMMV